MKNVFKEGACFPSFFDNTDLQHALSIPVPTAPEEKEEHKNWLSKIQAVYRACNEQCCVSVYCKTKTDEKKRKLSPTVTAVRAVLDASELQAIHSQFIKELNELLPRMEPQIFENKGQQHVFYDENGARRCVVQTALNFHMQISVCEDMVFRNEPLHSEPDISEVMKKIRLGISESTKNNGKKPEVMAEAKPAFTPTPAAPPEDDWSKPIK